MDDPIKSASEEAVIAATAHAEAVEKARAELMGNYYTRAETDTAHQEIVDNMTTQLRDLHKGLDNNLNEKLAGLATKEDTKEIKEFLNKVNFGWGALKISGRTLAYLGSVFAGIGTVILVLKFGIMAIIHWALHQ